MMQTEKYWVSDYLSLLLRDISTWYFLSNSLMWPFLIIVSDIFNQDIPDSSFSIKRMYQSEAHFIVLRTKENNPFFLLSFSRWRGRR